MSVSEVSAYSKAEQKLPEITKEPLEQHDSDTFLFELDQASEQAAPLNYNVVKDAKPQSIDEKTQSDDEASLEQTELEQDINSSDTILTQITASQTMDTGVQKAQFVSGQVTSTHYGAFTSSQGDENSGLAKSQVGAELTDNAIDAKLEVNSKATSALTDNEAKALSQLMQNQTSKFEGGATASSAIADKLNLTPEQTAELKNKLVELNLESTGNTKPTGEALTSATSNLKSMFSEAETSDTAKMITGKEIPALSNSEKSELSTTIIAQLNSLSTSEKKQLAAQLQNQISNETNTAQLNKLNQALTQLQGINAKAIQGEQHIADEVVSKEMQLKEMASKEMSSVQGNQETSSKELSGLVDKDINSPRVSVLFNQLTTSTVNAAISDYNAAGYEQTIEGQITQAQFNSNQSQTKTLTLDADMMQALNIVKSDAAKMLQERVSAMLNINNKEAEIRLDPPEMGSMHIRIRSDAEQAQINFVVQNQQAKEALEQSMPRLREMLAEQGIELGESNIEQGQGQSAKGEHDENSHASELVTEQMPDETTIQSEQSVKSTGQQTRSSIDYYA